MTAAGIATTAAVLAALYAAACLLGWSRLGRKYARWPFNWRIFLGPWPYLRWLQKQNNPKDTP